MHPVLAILSNTLSLLLGGVLCFGLHLLWTQWYSWKLPPPQGPSPVDATVVKGCYARTVKREVNTPSALSGTQAFTVYPVALDNLFAARPAYPPIIRPHAPPELVIPALPSERGALTYDTRILIHSASLFKILARCIESFQDSPLTTTVSSPAYYAH
jgi:hypothetical protein